MQVVIVVVVIVAIIVCTGTVRRGRIEAAATRHAADTAAAIGLDP